MATGTFVCTDCGRVVHNFYEKFTERMEYRRLDGEARRLAIVVRDLCIGCVDRIAEEYRNPSHAEQQQLLL